MLPMQNKLVLILGIVICLTLLLIIRDSRRKLWAQRNTRNSRMFTMRAVLVIIVVLVFLFFSLVR